MHVAVGSLSFLLPVRHSSARVGGGKAFQSRKRFLFARAQKKKPYIVVNISLQSRRRCMRRPVFLQFFRKFFCSSFL